MNLHQKLVQIRKEVKYVQKDAKGHNFNYATGADLICEIRPKMDELNVILQPNMESFELVEVKKAGGTAVVPKITISHTWIDADNPSDRFSTQATYFEDRMTGCQSIGSMMTYAERYFLYKFFQIATGADDIEQIYKDNGWDSKEILQSKEVYESPHKLDKPEKAQEKVVEAKIEKKHFDDAVAFCRTAVGSKGTAEEVTTFIKKMCEAYGSLDRLEKKLGFWKENAARALIDFEDWKKRQAGAA